MGSILQGQHKTTDGYIKVLLVYPSPAQQGTEIRFRHMAAASPERRKPVWVSLCAKLWNDLPLDIRDKPIHTLFKGQLNTVLFREAYKHLSQ